MTNRLVRVFDNYSNLLNITIAISMDFDEVVYIYHKKIDYKYADAAKEVIKKYKPHTKVEFIKIENDEKEVTDLLITGTTVDISTEKYLSAFLFEKALSRDVGIIYYDYDQSAIKDYRKHEVILDKVANITIEDMVKIGGGKILDKQMHQCIDINNKQTTNAIIGAVEANLNSYSAFINFTQRINAYIANKKIKSLTYRLNDELINKIKYDDIYQKVKKYELFTIDGNLLTFMNEDIYSLFCVSGAFLENYLYIKLIQSNKFDEVLMSKVIDFSSYYDNYPIVCEIDCLVIKDNHLLFISCKSNKVDTEDLNEIKIHNTIFGNDLSDPVVCTIDDLSKKSPSVYSKAKELKIRIIDKTSFIEDSIADDLLSIIENKYHYERV